MHYNPLPHEKYSLFMNLNRSVHLCLAVTFTFKEGKRKAKVKGYVTENRRTDTYVQYGGFLANMFLWRISDESPGSL